MKQRDRALGARIKAAMKAAGYKTAREFCEKLNIPYLTFAQHTQGRRNPTDAFLKKYSKTFGVTVTWLKTGEGNPLLHTGSEKKEKRNKIKTALQNEINKSQFQIEHMINVELLSTILVAVAKLKKKYPLNEKKCANITANLYAQVIQTTTEKDLQKKMVLAFIKTYEATLKTEN